MNELTTQKNEIATNDLGGWGDMPNLSASDFIIPKILLMQPQTPAVSDGKAKMGEFRESINMRLLGDIDTGIEFIPFFVSKVWWVFNKKQGRQGIIKEFSRIENITDTNEDHPYETDTESWQKVMNFYVLLPDDIKSGSAFPYVMTFKGTSTRTGRQLATQMYQLNRSAGITPAGFVMKLSGHKEQNSEVNATYVVLDVERGRKSDKQEVECAASFLKLVRGSQGKIDDSDLQRHKQPSGSREVSIDDNVNDEPLEF